MKNVWFLPALIPVLLFSGCGRALTEPVYVLKLPEPPPAWTELLGPPQWRVEWINPDGVKESRVTAGDFAAALPQTWANAVSAWPFWPGKGIVPGIFRPAGAIFPFDVSGAELRLSWRGGVDAFVYWEMDAAYAAQAGARTAASRRSGNFNWPRFRELFDDPAFSEMVRSDPWIVDWKTVAAKIVSSGFDKRRIVPEAREETAVPVPPGPWIGTSPFAPPLIFGKEETPVFPVGPRPDSWISAAGLLRCTAETWILISPPSPFPCLSGMLAS
jgi:hypothetical protein